MPVKKLIPPVRRMVYAPNHPISGKNGYVSESRKILYDAIGPNVHNCHWCNKKIKWVLRLGRGVSNDCITVDHIDNDWRNNNISNLVPACQPCNGSRSRRVPDNALFIIRNNGTRTLAIKRLCKRCNKEFLIPPAALKRPNNGQFCSIFCMYNRNK